MKNKGAVIEQLQNEKAKLEDSSSELYPLREQISELTEALHGKEGEAEVGGYKRLLLDVHLL